MHRLTREAALWGALVVLAVLPRLLNLNFSLTNAEATLALGWLEAVRGQTVAQAFTNPLFGALQSALFSIFGASDVSARILAAMSGVALCFAPLLARDMFGRGRAFVLAGLLALSPTLWFAARLADGAMLAWALALWAYVAWQTNRRVFAAALFGLLLACGRDAPVPALIVVVASLAASGVVVPSRRMLIAFGVAFLAGATGMMLRPSGLGDTFYGFATWAQGLRSELVLSFGRLLLGFGVNEIVGIVGAIAGVITLAVSRRISTQDSAWLLWLAVGLFACAIDSGRTATALVPCVIGVAALASHAYQRLISTTRANAHPAREGVVAALTFVLVAYAGLGLRQYAAQGQTSWLFPIIIATLLILAIVAAGSLGLEYSTALRGTSIGLVASMLLYVAGSGLQLNHARHDNPAEPYRAEAVLVGLSALHDTIETMSVRATGEPHVLAVAVPDGAPAAVRWVLRDQDVAGDAVARMQLTTEQTKPTTAGGNFIGKAFDVSSSATLDTARCRPQEQGGLDCLGLARWVAFRDANDAPNVQRWLLWVRADVAEKSSGR